MPLIKSPDVIEQMENPAPVSTPNHYGTVFRSDCINQVPTVPRGALPARLCNPSCFCLPAFTSPPNIKSYGTWFFVWANATFYLQKDNVDLEPITNIDPNLDINYLQKDFDNPYLSVIRLNWDYIYNTYGRGKYRIRANSTGVDAYSICWNMEEFDCDKCNGYIYMQNRLSGIISDPFSNNFQFDFRAVKLDSFFWTKGKCIVDAYEYEQSTWLSPNGNANNLASKENTHESSTQKTYKLLFGMNNFDGDFLDLFFAQLGAFEVFDFNRYNTHTINGQTFIKDKAPVFVSEPYHAYTNLLVNCTMDIKEEIRGDKFVSDSYA